MCVLSFLLSNFVVLRAACMADPVVCELILLLGPSDEGLLNLYRTHKIKPGLEKVLRIFKLPSQLPVLKFIEGLDPSLHIVQMDPYHSAAMLSLGGIKSFVFARQASARREFSARLAVQKQHFLLPWDSTWPPNDKGLLRHMKKQPHRQKDHIKISKFRPSLVMFNYVVTRLWPVKGRPNSIQMSLILRWRPPNP